MTERELRIAIVGFRRYLLKTRTTAREADATRKYVNTALRLLDDADAALVRDMVDEAGSLFVAAMGACVGEASKAARRTATATANDRSHAYDAR